MESWHEHWNIKINKEKTQVTYSYFSHRHTPVKASLTLKGRHIPFTNHVKYLGVIFYKKLVWKLCTEMIATKALHAFFSIYPILKSEHLSIGNKLIVYKALIRFVLTYACLAWEFVADNYLLKLQWLQNIAFHTISNLPRHAPIRNLRRSFKIPYPYDYITHLCRKQANIIAIMTMLFALAKTRHITENIKLHKAHITCTFDNEICSTSVARYVSCTKSHQHNHITHVCAEHGM
jgi:hypothetical protein